MKRLAVLLALVMTVGLVGCGNSDTQKARQRKKLQQKRHLKERMLSTQIM